MSLDLTPFASPAGPENDALGLLRACHERIRYFTGLAEKLSRAERESPQAVEMGAQSLLRYFGRALPLHAEDEDLSVAPRLAKVGFTEGMDVLAEEHDAIHATLDVLKPLWRRIAADSSALVQVRADVVRHTARLRGIFDKHLAWEEEKLFPAVAQMLSSADRIAVFDEMRARRLPRDRT